MVHLKIEELIVPNQQYSIIWPVIISHELVKKRKFRHILHQRVRVWIKKQLLFRYFAHERGGKYFFFFFTTKGSLVGLIVNKYEEIDRQKKKHGTRSCTNKLSNANQIYKWSGDYEQVQHKWKRKNAQF